MKSIRSVALAGLFIAHLFPAAPATAAAVSAATAASARRLLFEQNVGQTEKGAAFLTRAGGYQASIGASGMTLRLSPARRGTEAPEERDGNGQSGAVVSLSLIQSRADAQPVGRDPLPGKAHYFVGSDPARWHRDVPLFGRVEVKGVYDGVDVVYYGGGATARDLEHDFVLAPGADPSRIRMRVTGGEGVRLDREGNLVVATAAGDLQQQRPVAYQEIDGVRRSVRSRYVLASDGTVGFAVGRYDRKRPLVIDPTLRFSRFLGGSGTDILMDVAMDSSGGIYVTGETDSSNFPCAGTNVDCTRNGDADAFVTKLDAAGNIVYSTYFGGTSYDRPLAIAVDPSGNVHFGGTTWSADLPLRNGFTGSLPEGASFLAALNSAGSAVTYVTYLGGGREAIGTQIVGIAAVSATDVWCTGFTDSNWFSFTPNGFQKTRGGFVDAFVLRYNPSVTGAASFRYFSYYGGSNYDSAAGIAVSPQGGVRVVGQSNSSNLQATRAGGTGGGYDAFMLKATGSSSFEGAIKFGGTGNDRGTGIAMDAAGNGYVTGSTTSTDFPIVGAVTQTTFGGGAQDVFAAKISSGGALVYSTYVGGSGAEDQPGIGVTPGGIVWVFGKVDGTGVFPTTRTAYQEWFAGGASDLFLVKLNRAGQRTYSTLWGGEGEDSTAGSIAVQGARVAFSGFSLSNQFPYATNSRSGGYDGVVSSIGMSVLLLVGNSTTLTAADVQLRDRLDTLFPSGVRVQTPAAASGSDPTYHDLIVVSSSIDSASLGDRYRSTPVPVIVLEPAIQDDMGMTGTTWDTHMGTASGQTQMVLPNASDPLAAGLSGTRTVTSSGAIFNWGVPSSGGVSVATVPSNSGRSTIYRYETGATMVSGTAPERRVGLFVADNTANALNSDGWRLFDAAVRWAAGL